MLQTLGIPKTFVHFVLRDNSKNMIKEISHAGLLCLPCVVYTPHLLKRVYWRREVWLMWWQSSQK